MATTTIRRARLRRTLSGIAKEEAAAVDAAKNVLEHVPAPVDIVDKAMDFALNTLRSQRKTLVPLLTGVAPKGRRAARKLPPAAAAVSSAYDLAERVVRTQRGVLHRLLKAATPPLGHRERPARTAVKARARRRPSRRRAVAKVA